MITDDDQLLWMLFKQPRYLRDIITNGGNMPNVFLINGWQKPSAQEIATWHTQDNNGWQPLSVFVRLKPLSNLGNGIPFLTCT